MTTSLAEVKDLKAHEHDLLVETANRITAAVDDRVESGWARGAAMRAIIREVWVAWPALAQAVLEESLGLAAAKEALRDLHMEGPAPVQC